MIDKELDFLRLPDCVRQNTPSPGELDPDQAFIPVSIAASRAAQKYGLLGIKLNPQKSDNDVAE